MSQAMSLPQNAIQFAGKQISEQGELDAHFESEIDAQEQRALETQETVKYNVLARLFPEIFLTPAEIYEMIDEMREQQEAA